MGKFSTNLKRIMSQDFLQASSGSHGPATVQVFVMDLEFWRPVGWVEVAKRGNQ